MTFTGDLHERLISGLPQFQIPFLPLSLSVPLFVMNELCLARLVGRKGTEDEGTIRNRGMKRSWMEMEKEEREGERSENVAKVICTELSFFQCFLFEPFVERLSRLIFGMMSMNYILYKTWEYFKPRTNALSRCATRDDEPIIDRLTRIRALRRSRMYREDFSGRGMIVTPRNPLLYPSDLHIRIAYGGERRGVSRIVLFLFREFVSNERM